MMIKKILFLSILFCSAIASSQTVNLNLDKKSWQEDLQFLKKKVEKTFPDFQNANTKQDFEKAYSALYNTDLQNSHEDMVFNIQQVLNSLQDEGCTISLFQKGLEFQVSPLKTYWFQDGLYILDASTKYSSSIGEQIIKINDFPIEQVFERLKTYLNADNEYYKRYLFQVYGFMPSLLKSAGLGTNDQEIQLTFASGKKQTIQSDNLDTYITLERKLPNDGHFSLTNTSFKNKNYWFDYFPNSKTLFIQLQAIINNEEGESFSDFIDKVENQIQSQKTDKIIIDVRYGGGGNGFKLKKFTDLLRDSESINSKGNLFVLTSKATKGTLLELASILQLNTKAIIIGEPTAEGPNSVGDTKYITLPNSGLKVSITHTFWPTSWLSDTNTSLSPSIPISYTFKNKIENRDPWIETALTYTNEKVTNEIPKDILTKITGSYTIDGRKVEIINSNGKLYLIMSRKMKSFFELYNQLYFIEDGKLSTDIDNVFISYNKDSSGVIKLKKLNWKGQIISIN